MVVSLQEHVGRNAAFLVILGFFQAMFGLLAMAAPLAAGIPVALIVGILLLGRGSMQLYYGIKVRHWSTETGSYLGLGYVLMSLVSVACGFLLMASPLIGGQRYLPLMMATYLVIVGGFDVLHSVELRAVRSWGVICLNGLLGVLLGVLVWQQWPVTGEWAIGALTGASMVISGISLGAFGMMAR